jgi:YidC/Oxa1 family membrane protein insertase
MQQQVMTFMMVFIGVLFFRVPSGLCLYFIASSLWSLAERKLLPKSAKPGESPAETAKAREKVEAVKAKRKKSKQRR